MSKKCNINSEVYNSFYILRIKTASLNVISGHCIDDITDQSNHEGTTKHLISTNPILLRCARESQGRACRQTDEIEFEFASLGAPLTHHGEGAARTLKGRVTSAVCDVDARQTCDRSSEGCRGLLRLRSNRHAHPTRH